MNAAKVSSTILYLDGVTVSFDGFKALNNLSLSLDPGEMRAIIGPNGAGKTTMMDVITGNTRPDQGTVLFDGTTDLTRRDEAEIAELGIGRKFQAPTVFENHTVADNLQLALKGSRNPFTNLLGHRNTIREDEIDVYLDRVNLREHKDRLASELSHGQKQWLEIGMLLAQNPKLLLVDEPVAGMTDNERGATADLLKKISETNSVVVVEHDMHFVRMLDVKVTCLHEGSVLSEGSIDDVSGNSDVIEVYLGR